MLAAGAHSLSWASARTNTMNNASPFLPAFGSGLSVSVEGPGGGWGALGERLYIIEIDNVYIICFLRHLITMLRECAQHKQQIVTLLMR